METTNMNINILLAENENFKIVTATFPGSSKKYTYKTFEDVKVGDTAVVKTPMDGLKLVTVVEVLNANETDLNFGFDVKWLVQVIDTERYRKCKEMEQELNKKINAMRAEKQRKDVAVHGAGVIEEVKRLVRL